MNSEKTHTVKEAK